QRIVPPPRRPQRIQHFRPDLLVAAPVLVETVRRHLGGEAHPRHQKSNWSMLLASNTVGGPSTTTLCSPIVYSPSLPALNFSPVLPGIWPEGSAAPAYAAR